MLVDLNARYQTSWTLQCWLLIQLLLNELALLLLKTFRFFLGSAANGRILIAIILFVVLWIIQLLSLSSLLNCTWYIRLLYSLDNTGVMRGDLLRMFLGLQIVIIIKEIGLVDIISLGLTLMNSFSRDSFLLSLWLIEWATITFHLHLRLLWNPDPWLTRFI